MLRKALFVLLAIALTLNTSCSNNINVSSENKEATVKVTNKVQEKSQVGDSGSSKENMEDVNKQNEQSITSDFIFKDSHIRKLTEADINNIDDKILDLARNEIFARHGYSFETKKYRDYFTDKSWYKPVKVFDNNSLNRIEKYNAEFIKYFEGVHNNHNREEKNLQCAIYNKNEKVLEDINGDGKKEEIIFSDTGSGFKLSINGLTITNTEFCCLVDSFAIVDIDKKDKFKEIIISDLGPSDDYYSKFYSYDGNEIIYMGETGGLFSFGMEIEGSGFVVASTRADILQTWFFDKKYMLTAGHKLVESPQDLYTTDYDLFVKRDIKLLYNKNGKKGFNVTEGQIVKIIGTDNKEWCLLNTSMGKKGWIQIEGFTGISGTGLSAGDFFIGLCNAD